MLSAKEQVRQLLDSIPEDSSFEDIQYHIYVREKIEVGRRAIGEKRLLNEEEAELRLSKWLGE